MKNLNRRVFLKSTGVLAAAAAGTWKGTAAAEDAVATAPAVPKKWYRGMVHMHTRWSDGEVLPEVAVAMYKERGYNYLCVSDHNNFQTEALRFTGCWFDDTPADKTPFDGETSTWRVTAPDHISLQSAKKMFGENAFVSKTVDGKLYVRLTPYSELKTRFEESDRFLLIPGYEQTGQSANKLQVHMNFVNVTQPFPYIQSYSPVDTVYENWHRGLELYGKNPEPYLFTLNHPLWRYYDVSPEVLKMLHKIRFFELGNNMFGVGTEHEKGWTPEKYWDIVNAFRCANGHPLLFGTGSDDTHCYTRPGCEIFHSWDMVRAEALNAPALFAAMNAGDFYVSTGVTLEDVAFDATARTLSVRVQPEEGKNYKIEFIGTKKMFHRNREILELTVPERCQLDVYSEDIGVVLATVEGTEGAYTLRDDDLYVRARISTTDAACSRPSYPVLIPCAWTQPYRAE